MVQRPTATIPRGLMILCFRSTEDLSIGSTEQPEGREQIYHPRLRGSERKHLFWNRSGVNLRFLVNKPDPQNVVDPRDHGVYPPGNATCYWRVDTLLEDGSTVTGEVWNYSTAD
jgi:hypothetical protein